MDDITVMKPPNVCKYWGNLYFYFEEFVAVGFITETDKDMIVSDAALSDCVKKYKWVSSKQKKLHLKKKETWVIRYQEI